MKSIRNSKKVVNIINKYRYCAATIMQKNWNRATFTSTNITSLSKDVVKRQRLHPGIASIILIDLLIYIP